MAGAMHAGAMYWTPLIINSLVPADRTKGVHFCSSTHHVQTTSWLKDSGLITLMAFMGSGGPLLM